MATVSVSAGSQGRSGTTPVPSQLVAGDGVADAGFGQSARTWPLTLTGRDVVGGAGRPLPDEPCSPPALEVVGERFAGGEGALADENADRRSARQREVGEPPGRPPLARAVAVDHVGDVGRLAAEQPVEHERHRSRIAAAVAPQVQQYAAGTSHQRERGPQVGRGDVHAVKAVEREHADAVAPTRDLADRARPAAGPRADPAAASRGGSLSGTSDPSATYSSSKCREKACATPSTSRHNSAVTVRASSPKRSSSAALSRSTAVGVREQPVDPPAQIGDQRRGGVPFGRHAASLAHAPRGDRRGSTLPVGGHRPATTPRADLHRHRSVIERGTAAADDTRELIAHAPQRRDASVDLVDLLCHPRPQRLRRRTGAASHTHVLRDLGQREPDRLRVLDLAHEPNGLLVIAAMPTRRPLRRRQQPPPLVVTQRLDVHPRPLRDLTDSHANECNPVPGYGNQPHLRRDRTTAT